MEQYDVAVIGGGSSGLAALKQLSNLGKQAVLLEAGGSIGAKNISGGILYSKKPKKFKVTNVEDIYENFLEDAPFERKITKYILHSTSKEKIFSMDLTAAHDYQSNFGCSVLMTKLNVWFAKQSSKQAQKHGGGIIPGVHVKSITWDDKGRAIIHTDELREFAVKAIIAADGINSEIAEMVGARSKFATSQLYQGVKIIVKLPEKIINERFGIKSDEGAAHLFAGDITLNHIGGGFLYTNKDTLSIGAVYHLDSLLKNPVEPSALIDSLLKNPMISELIKDQVPITKEIDKNLTKQADNLFKDSIVNAKSKAEIKKAIDSGKIARVSFCSIEKEGIKCAEIIEKEMGARVRGKNLEHEKAGAKCVICNKKANDVVYVAKDY